MPVMYADELRHFATALVSAMGGSAEEAETVADVLVRSNLAGHDSHGVIRLEQYARMMREGQIVPGAPFEIARQTPAMALVEGHWGFGAVVAVRATRLAMEMARTSGVAAVSVRGCNHISRLGH